MHLVVNYFPSNWLNVSILEYSVECIHYPTAYILSKHFFTFSLLKYFETMFTFISVETQSSFVFLLYIDT